MSSGPEIALVFFYFLLIVLLIQRAPFFKIKSLPKNFLLIAFTLKVLAGFALAFIYTKYYTHRNDADIFKYFDDSKYMYDALWNKPVDFFKMLVGYGNDTEYFTKEYYSYMNNWFRQYESNIYNDSHTIIRFNALLRILSFGVFHVHTIIMCFLSLLGMVALYKAIENYFKDKEFLLGLVLFLLPSVMFWSSGVLKEGLLVFGLGVFIYCWFLIFDKKQNWIHWPILGITFFLLLYIKVYAVLLLLPCLAAFFINKKVNFKFPILTYLLVFGVSGIFALNLHYLSENYDILQTITTKQHDFINHAEHLNSGSRIKIDPLEPTLISFIYHTPESFVITFFRPLFFESKNPLMIVAGLENLFFLFLVLFALAKADKLTQNQKNLLWLLIFYGIWMYVLVGLVTPVMGAIVRYKVPAMPLFAAAFILLGDWKNIFNNRPFLKKHLKI